MSPLDNLPQIDALIESVLRTARIPGGALAIVVDGATVFSKGYGYRDLAARLPVTADTVHAIASTTKAMNTTLLGMLVDEGKLAWDHPVQRYLPHFRLQDSDVGRSITLRDLVTMRTGLAPHEFVWVESRIDRADLVERLAHLPLSAGLRERFQYSDLTPTLAGHIAEVVTGCSWEELILHRLLEPLGMTDTGFESPANGDVTLAYHENERRELLVTRPFATEPIAPAGGSIHSTVRDMARWVAFNLAGGQVDGRQLIQPRSLQEIHTPWMLMGTDGAAPSAGAAYGLGWFIDTYNGHSRISHTGYLHDLNSCVSLFPETGIGVVSFSNFASSRVAQLLNQLAFDGLLGLPPAQSVEQLLTRYEQKIAATRQRNSAVRRVADTSPSHALDDYAGRYDHPGYGAVEIRRVGAVLHFVRNDLMVPLAHWHYDAWVFDANELFEIHKQHLFDGANRVMFSANADGEIDTLSLPLEATLPPARFVKR